MKKNFIYLSAFFISINAYSQNIFPVKLDNCKSDQFCLDCGDQQAGYNENEFKKLTGDLQNALNLKGISGGIKFQVLVDSKGGACVLSHTDNTQNPITLKIIEELNNFKSWKPAITKDKAEEKSSINIAFLIKDGKINGAVERVDMDAFEKSFDRPNSPEIYNKSYTYNNDHLKSYQFTVWNSKNSTLEKNMNDHITFDGKNSLWVTTDDGIQNYNGTTFQKRVPEQRTTKKVYFTELESDNAGTVWTYSRNGDDSNIFNFVNNNWNVVPKDKINTDNIYKIINNPATNELFFCTDKGLTILKDGKWSTINKEKIKELSSNRVYFAKKDSKGRIWIGTFSGTTMIDEKGNATNFENTDTVLKGKSITSMDEDEKGNLFFSLFEFAENTGKVNRDEGIAVRDTHGKFKQLTTDNSGLPFNNTTCILYDKKEKVLWISTDRAGLVRYDLKDGWENYHNENSDIPTSYISTMRFDKKGNLFLGTRQGIVKVEKK